MHYIYMETLWGIVVWRTLYICLSVHRYTLSQWRFKEDYYWAEVYGWYTDSPHLLLLIGHHSHWCSQISRVLRWSKYNIEWEIVKHLMLPSSVHITVIHTATHTRRTYLYLCTHHRSLIFQSHTHARTYTCTHARTHTCTHTRAHTHTHTHTHAHAHTHTHTHTHTTHTHWYIADLIIWVLSINAHL